MIEQLTVYTTRIPKVRLGRQYDGGYVISLEALCKSAALFTYGVSDDISFEIDYVKATGKKAFCFDHTCPPVHIPHGFDKHITHFLEGISGTKQEKTNTFLSHYEKYFESEWDTRSNSFNDRVLLKIDIEGNEYETLLNMDFDKVSKITTGLIIEFHTLHLPEQQKMFFDCLFKINQYYYLTHAHGNNFSGNFDFFEKRLAPNLNEWYVEKFSIPECLELSFVNKEVISYIQKDTRKYPHNEILDRPNLIWALEDNHLDFLQQI